MIVFFTNTTYIMLFMRVYTKDLHKSYFTYISLELYIKGM